MQIAGTLLVKVDRDLLKAGPSLFERRNKAQAVDDQQELIDALHRKIGELEMKLDWAKKKGLLE
jgi:hypothetical protein